jgi:hypothetical protein
MTNQPKFGDIRVEGKGVWCSWCNAVFENTTPKEHWEADKKIRAGVIP